MREGCKNGEGVDKSRCSLVAARAAAALRTATSTLALACLELHQGVAELTSFDSMSVDPRPLLFRQTMSDDEDGSKREDECFDVRKGAHCAIRLFYLINRPSRSGGRSSGTGYRSLARVGGEEVIVQRPVRPGEPPGRPAW
jgi:hypothetical protein